MHLGDSKSVLAFEERIVIELVPHCQSGQFGPGKWASGDNHSRYVANHTPYINPITPMATMGCAIMAFHQYMVGKFERREKARCRRKMQMLIFQFSVSPF